MYAPGANACICWLFICEVPITTANALIFEGIFSKGFAIDVGSKFPKLNEDDWEQTQLEHFKKDNEFPEYSYWRYKRIKNINY